MCERLLTFDTSGHHLRAHARTTDFWVHLCYWLALDILVWLDPRRGDAALHLFHAGDICSGSAATKSGETADADR